MARKRKTDFGTSAEEPLTTNPFAGLAGLRDSLPVGPVGPVGVVEPVAEEPAPAVEGERPPKKAVIRYQRKGHGGKEVTVVEQLGLDAEAAQRWCTEIKRSLGCGGRVDADKLVFACDQRERLRAQLETRGVVKVIG